MGKSDGYSDGYIYRHCYNSLRDYVIHYSSLMVGVRVTMQGVAYTAPGGGNVTPPLLLLLLLGAHAVRRRLIIPKLASFKSLYYNQDNQVPNELADIFGGQRRQTAVVQTMHATPLLAGRYHTINTVY